jgi:hypothetical protein
MPDNNPQITEFNLESIQTTASDDELHALATELQSITENVRDRVVSDTRLKDLLQNNDTLTSDDDSKKQKPEEFTKNLIIEALLDHLGYPYAHQELNTPAEDEDRWVDYSVPLDSFPNINSTRLLIEAEPVNKKLDQTKHGIGQVRGWLHHEPFESNLGIATDGVKWVLLKKDTDTHTINEVESCDLTDVFLALFDDISTGKSPVESVLTDEHLDTLETFYRALAFDNFTNVAAGVQSIIRRKKKEISDSFYNQYIELVFGIRDEDTEGRDTNRCLVGDGIDAPSGTSAEKRRLFSVKLMNRLIFVQFLEDTGVVADGLMDDIRSRHEGGSHLTDCYTTFIQPLIYDVFNTPPGKRPDKIQENDLYNDIPYLNGGLFRATLDNEKAYTVTDTVMLEILDMLESYQFSMAGKPDELDPSILGTVFEQTINYLAGETGAQKDLGAYYTPDSITRFTAVRSVKDDLLTAFKETLKEDWGWRQGELDHYDEVYELIEGLSPNQDVIEDLLWDVDEFHVLDPACGSGHFLTSVLHEIVSVRRALYEKHEDSPHPQQLKKQTILNNLYGVDIVGPGVEITKLRLWLSIMAEITNEDLGNMDRGELALPNVAFNIREGNSLVGYTDTSRLRMDDDDAEHQQSHVGEWGTDSIEKLIEERQEQINQYKKLYGEEAHDIEDEIDEKDQKYNRQLNEKLVDDLRDAGVSFDHDMDSVEAPNLPTKSLHKVSIGFDSALDEDRKDELEDLFRTEKGMRINTGKDGYVSITLFHRYLVGTPDDRLEEILDELDGNIDSFNVERYLTVEDIEDLQYLHWPLEFYEVFDSGGFDVVIGNPPYGIDLADAESALGEYPDENHSSMVFASRSEQLTADDGQIAFVVPKALTYAYRWQDARSHLLSCDLNYLMDLREAFDGVDQEQIILMYSSEESDGDHVVVGRRNDNAKGGDDEFFEQEYTQSAFDSDGFFMWVDEENEGILTKLSNYDTIDDVDFAEATKGLDNFKSSLTGDPDDLLAYRGDDVGQFRFVSRSYLDDDVKKRSDFHLAGHGQKKVIFQRILAHVVDPTDRVVIQCAIDYDEACTPDTAIHATPNEGSLELLCGLLNSSLFAWYAYNRIYNRAIRSMDLTPIYFGRLPAPPEEDVDAIEIIETQTAKLHELQGQKESKVMEAYEKLDEAVFDLYQLTDEERKLIKDETPARRETLLEDVS